MAEVGLGCLRIYVACLRHCRFVGIVAEVLWFVVWLDRTVDCVAKVLWIFVWLRYCGFSCGYGIVDCRVATVLWIFVWLRYCRFSCG